jgi:ankyrin repeat protein
MNSFGSKAQFLTTAVTLSYLLCRAVHYGRSDIVELLLKAGADPNKPVRDSEDTPLHIAVNFNFKKV